VQTLETFSAELVLFPSPIFQYIIVMRLPY